MLKNFKRRINWKENKLTILLYMTLPIVINLVIESLARKSVFKSFEFMFTSPYTFFCNALIVLFTLSFTMLLRRRIFMVALVSIVWIILGIANFVLLSNRVTPFGAADFKNITDAFAIMNKYLNTFAYIAVLVLMLAAIGLIIFIWLKIPKINRKMNYIKDIIIIGLITVFMFCNLNVGLKIDALAKQIPELSAGYLKYGFVYCFSNSVVNTGIHKPSDYSSEKINDIVNDKPESNEPKPEQPSSSGNIIVEPIDDVKDVEKTPNIIIVQLESFFDITEVKGLQFSTDPIPNYHKFMQKYASGYLNMPSVGAGTANSEFEILTGMNLDHFGPGEYPYKTILKKRNCESISYNLKEYDYATHAIHNNTGGFYGRNKVFSQLGFDTYTSVEYMNNVVKTPMGWAKDDILIEQIALTLNSTKNQDFVYAISVQGHGSYPATGEYETVVQITSDSEEESRLNAMEYYTQQIYEMDIFVKELIDYIEKRQEDSIVVFYGDHLPSFGLADSDLNNDSVYQTPYFIWNNCGIEYKDEDLEAFQLQSKILKELDMTTGVINKFHQNQKQEEEYDSALQNLEFDILYGELNVYNGINPYQPTDLTMGILDIKITKISKDKEKGYVVITGENFTQYSKVFVNGDYFKNTEFIDKNTLRIYYPDMQGLDSFVVSQAHSATSVLSSTREYMYYGD